MTQTIVLERKIFSPESTLGRLYGPDSLPWCHTLEDVCRNIKVAGKTAIPAGKYEIIVAWSPRYKRLMPRLLDVPFYEGVLIHPGNIPENTDGCILTGRKAGNNLVMESVLAFDEIFPKIQQLTESEKLFIDIQGGFEAQHWVKENIRAV